jgi:hypothetical protein
MSSSRQSSSVSPAIRHIVKCRSATCSGDVLACPYRSADSAPPGGWEPSEESVSSKSGRASQCMDLQHCLHWLHLEPTHL